MPAILRVVTPCLMFLGVACGVPNGSSDAGIDGGSSVTADAGSADAGPAAVSSSGTAGGRAVQLRTGAARVSGRDLLVILTDQSPWQCPSTASQTFKPGETSLNFMLTVPTGASLVGTFPLFNGPAGQSAPDGRVVAFAVVAPTTCPASVGDGLLLTGGSLTISAAAGSVSGTFTAQVSGSESVTGQFTVPTCAIAGITGSCEP